MKNSMVGIHPTMSAKSSLIGPSLSWHKIGMRVGEKSILKDVTGEVSGGSIVAVMVNSYFAYLFIC